MKKILYYINQFFGSIGGEEAADISFKVKEDVLGPAQGFNNHIEEGKVEVTVICGDNYFNENTEKAKDKIKEIINNYNPDLIAAGPAFNAGRYGMACAGVMQVADEMDIPAVTGMYTENPGVDACKREAYIIETADSAAGMRKALPSMAALADKLLKGREIASPVEDNYIPRGKRKTLFTDKRGSKRAVEILLKRLNGEKYETELPMPDFDRVEPAPAVDDLTEAKVALVSSGGVVPAGNPDRIESASATKYGKYVIKGMDRLKDDEYVSIHGGYDPVYANDDPNRVVPLDVLRRMENESEIGKLADEYYVTTGTGTSVENAEKIGRGIANDLLESNVQAVVLTST